MLILLYIIKKLFQQNLHRLAGNFEDIDTALWRNNEMSAFRRQATFCIVEQDAILAVARNLQTINLNVLVGIAQRELVDESR